MGRVASLVIGAALAACGRIGFDAPGTPPPGTDGAPVAACTTWGPFAPPQIVAELVSPATDWAPSVSADGLRMLFSSMRAGSQDLYVTTRATTSVAWDAPVLLQGFGTSSNQEDDPTLTVDGLEMYYGKNSLFRATRTDPTAPFGTPVEIVSSPSFSLVQGAEVSLDGLRLYFSAGDPALSLYLMERADRADPFATYALLPVSSTEDLGYPTFSADERELIVSQALTTPQDRDLFVATRAAIGDPFPAPVRIDELASTGEDWDPELSSDGTTLWFASTRPPAQAQDIFVTTRVCLD